jgi:hypothetical protein
VLQRLLRSRSRSRTGRKKNSRSPQQKNNQNQKQVYDWSFDVFDVARRTGGRPLYAVTMALFEEEGLLVRLFVARRESTASDKAKKNGSPEQNTKNANPKRKQKKQDGWLLDRAAVAAYLDACEATYHRALNPYHNNSHAADVTQTAACLLRAFCASAERAVPPLERFCVLLASAVHD